MSDWRVNDASVRLQSADGTTAGQLRLVALPSRPAPIFDRENDPSRPRVQPAVQVTEASTYHYEFVGVEPRPGRIEPAELFDPEPGHKRGRLRVGEAVGTVAVTVELLSGADRLTGAFEVRPAKVEDENAYHTMLGDLAEVAVEILIQGFQPSAGTFELAPETTPRLLYQQFALLHLLLFRDSTDAALALVFRRPNRAWVTTSERRSAGRPLPGTSRLAQSLMRPVRGRNGSGAAVQARFPC